MEENLIHICLIFYLYGMEVAVVGSYMVFLPAPAAESEIHGSFVRSLQLTW